jgi:hypothetical protein
VASHAATVPASSSVVAAGATNAGRPISEMARNTTPTTSSAIAKCTICGW